MNRIKRIYNLIAININFFWHLLAGKKINYAQSFHAPIVWCTFQIDRSFCELFQILISDEKEILVQHVPLSIFATKITERTRNGKRISF